ncbi:TetR/AcrR family transcriptional regulator [Alloscardovia criceti]|uniref:TetR/AcrR family transcriptional regulator n=1 Tax=Alloscardovia criceti TaxID=356828 RepID=UPI00038005F0|nr:TetR/AcrR family transcriptional regulator [Alloscardovia criceti]
MNTTLQSIHDTFIRIYTHTPFEKMKVAQLCEQVPIARTTFYEYYANLDELKEAVENQLITGLLDAANSVIESNTMMQTVDVERYFEAVLAYIHAHWDENYAFLVAQPNISYTTKWKQAIKKNLALRYPLKTKRPLYGIISEAAASAVVGAYTYWMSHPEEFDAQTIAHMSKNALDALIPLIQ